MDRFLSDRKALRFPLFPGMGRSRQGAADTSGSSSTATAHPAESKLLSSHTTLQIFASCVTWRWSMWAPGASSGRQKGKVINEPLLISTIYLFSLTSWTDKPDIKNGTRWQVLLLCFAWREHFPCTLVCLHVFLPLFEFHATENILHSGGEVGLCCLTACPGSGCLGEVSPSLTVSGCFGWSLHTQIKPWRRLPAFFLIKS